MSTTQLVVCAMDGAAWAFPIASVREIIRAVPAQPVGAADASSLGIIDLRGVAMPVFDLASTLGIGEAWHRSGDASRDAELLATRRIVVTASGGGGGSLVGWLVDGVDEVIEIASEAVESIDDGAGGSPFVAAIAHVEGHGAGTGTGTGLVPVLAADRLLGAAASESLGSPDTLAA